MGLVGDRLTIRVVSPLRLSAAEANVWDELCGGDPALRSAFYSRAYACAVAEVRPRVVRVAVAASEDGPVAFLPFQYANGAMRLLAAGEPVGGGMTDYFGVIAAPDFTMDSRSFLRRAGLASLLFTHLDETQLRHGLSGEQPEPGLRIELRDGADAYWRELRRSNKSLVSDTERRMRRLVETHGPVRFHMQAGDPASALAMLIDAKRRQYARTGARDSLEEEWHRLLLHRLVASDDRLCRGVVSTLYAGDVWVAAHVGLRCMDTLHYWFPVYNEELGAFSPGRLLLKSIIDGAAEHGIAAIDRGSGTAQAKRDFANASHIYYRGLWHDTGVRQALFRAGMSLKWRFT